MWTLPYEVRMYASLALLWLISGLAKRRRDGLLQALVLTAAVGSATLFMTRHLQDGSDTVCHRLAFMFFTGAACHILRSRIELVTPVLAVVATAILASVFAGREIFFFTYALGIAYTVFYLAYVPAGILRAYRHRGDYSYGMYIWAFPVQQAIVARWPGIRTPALMMSSGLVTLALAIVSWHLLESNALALRQRAARWTFGLVRAGRSHGN